MADAARVTIDKLPRTLFSDHSDLVGLPDFGMRRHKLFAIDFDSRALTFEEINELWEEPVKVQWRENQERLMKALVWEFGEREAERKRSDFIALGPKSMSIIAYHNAFYEQARSAFVGGNYFPALTGTCALGERILNHLILDLRDDFRHSPEYRQVHGKASFQDWGRMTDVLCAWRVLLPDVADHFRKLATLRHRSMHFNASTYSSLRDDALSALGHIESIVGRQFGGFGNQPWLIPGTKGHCFIKREFEVDPFVRRYYLPLCPFVGVRFGMAIDPEHGWIHIDLHDYGEGKLTDEQYCDAYNNRDPETVLTLTTRDGS